MNKIGLGTWQLTDYEEMNAVVKAAIETGYRTIDTAQVYENEEMLGAIFEELNINTDDLFITTKISPINYRKHTTKSLVKSLKKLKLDKIDLVLLHAEIDKKDNLQAYKELLELQDKGIIKYVGVSNFSIEGIEDLIDATGKVPYCNQIVCSPTTRALELEEYCKEKNIALVGYSILKPYYAPNPYYAESGLSQDEKVIIDNLALKYNVNVGQLLNGWALQNGYHIIPKSSKVERVHENYNCKIRIDNDDMNIINEMNKLTSEKYKELVKSWKVNITDEQMEKGYNI